MDLKSRASAQPREPQTQPGFSRWVRAFGGRSLSV